MHNYLLDRYPEDYNGYLIRTDYRIGVQIQLCLSDPDLSEYERALVALNLLYGNGVPQDLQMALNGIAWFMGCGNIENTTEENEPPIFDFEFDSGRIMTAFRKVYGLDITREKMHWFQFLAMLSDLKDTAFADVMKLRETDESEIDKKKLTEFRKMKKRLAIPEKISAEEKEMEDGFLKEVREAQKRGKEV